MTILTRTLKQKIYFGDRESARVKYSSLIAVVAILLAASLLFVWSHVRTTELKYQIAKEISLRESLLEENRKLKVEIASLKSPQHLERIARERLGMTYPERDQVIFLK
ncbi:MAG: cell division protein FtsL [Syntrophobacterales bacterium]|nr:cell division protein FtsL [Syntrophobacterales bacterium]